VRAERHANDFHENKAPRYLLLIAIFLGIATRTNCHATVSIVDTFDQGGFTMSHPNNPNPVDEMVNLPLAQRRTAAFWVVPTPPGTSLASTLDSTTGTLRFVVSGTPASPNTPFALQLVYSAGGPYNISGCTDFILGFSELSGVGSLYIEVGSSKGLDVHRVALTGPGDLSYSVSDVTANSVHTVDSFNVLRFAFEARSTNFSFTLDEIRLVPEPGRECSCLPQA
jgi:hypothetical protein